MSPPSRSAPALPAPATAAELPRAAAVRGLAPVATSVLVVPTVAAGASTSTSCAAIERLCAASAVARVGGGTRRRRGESETVVPVGGSVARATPARASRPTATGGYTNVSTGGGSGTGPMSGTTEAGVVSRPSPRVPNRGGAWRPPRRLASSSGLDRSASQRPAVANAASTPAGSGTRSASAAPAARMAALSVLRRENGNGFRLPISTW